MVRQKYDSLVTLFFCFLNWKKCVALTCGIELQDAKNKTFSSTFSGNDTIGPDGLQSDVSSGKL